jgi:hypothetical protein
MAAMLKKIVSEPPQVIEDGTELPRPSSIDLYLGNLHVSPISRLWNTQTNVGIKVRKVEDFK